jgi:hypothetical protein
VPRGGSLRGIPGQDGREFARPALHQAGVLSLQLLPRRLLPLGRCCSTSIPPIPPQRRVRS